MAEQAGPQIVTGNDGNLMDQGLGLTWTYVQQYGFLILGLLVVAVVLKGKFDEYTSARAVKKLNGRYLL